MRMIRPSAEADEDEIHRRLQAYNAQFMHGFARLSFHMEEDGRTVGGIVAGSVGDTAEVDFLFVDEDQRGRGLGRALLERMEEEARKMGLRRVTLNTYSFQAPEFYRRLGYREVLKLEPSFDEYSQSYFVKEL